MRSFRSRAWPLITLLLVAALILASIQAQAGASGGGTGEVPKIHSDRGPSKGP